VVEDAKGDRILRESVGSQRSPRDFNGLFHTWLDAVVPP